MTPLIITCESCDQAWTVVSTFSVYEQQAVESCPCPHCGAYTLCFHEPAPGDAGRAARRRRPNGLSAGT
jgi:hypothetical protein